MTEERKTVLAEGADIDSAIKVAAEALSVSAALVDYKLDKDWFRNEHGSMVPRSTVQIIAWEGDGSSQGSSQGGGSMDASQKESCDAAGMWLAELLEKMDIASEVRSSFSGGTVTLHVRAEKAGLVVGKGGATIEGIRHLLDESVGADHPEMNFRIQVADDRDRDGGRGRDGGRDRGRGRDGGRDGGRDRGRGRDRDRGDRGRSTQSDSEALERMAQKIASRVLESGQAEQIRRELNSYDRRIVHTAIADIDGVTTRSIGEGSMKTLEVMLEGAPAEA